MANNQPAPPKLKRIALASTSHFALGRPMGPNTPSALAQMVRDKARGKRA